MELAKEIYRASEQEGWSKEKLFKMLADPSKFKKSTRYIQNKVGIYNPSNILSRLLIIET
jgi:hypothetical protein